MKPEDLTHSERELRQAESREFTKHAPQKQIKTESILFAIAGIAGLTGLVLSLRSLAGDGEKSDDKIWMADPPPIFIKSGSFVVESSGDFAPQPDDASYRQIKRDFGKTLSIVVHKYNERGKPSPNPPAPAYYGYKEFPNRGAFNIKIWLQKIKADGTWELPAANPDVIINNDANALHFNLKYKKGFFGKQLKKSPKKPKKRNHRYEDQEDDAFRFQRIELQWFNGAHTETEEFLTTNEGDLYTIGFWH